MSTITLKRGDPLIRDFYWVNLNPDGTPNLSSPIDLTDHVARMQIRSKLDELYASASSEGLDPRISIDVPSGKVTINISPEVTKLFPLETLFFDIEFFLNDVSVGSTPTMTITVGKDITRWPTQP